ncbi:nitrite reductase [Hyphomicrobium methylovorum]|uniref:multicopper oxidase domain-containing protein n=1 Tax=Hyphomicrobium methylovorum TaxID=84 RepID=UPI0015E7C6FD|nr:multicopper oxidase domain-containing protein [Hyphomicrobium methylovorum]MBA2125455.1 nitrite reductase [Hyphomicrobium methylovorum]
MNRKSRQRAFTVGGLAALMLASAPLSAALAATIKLQVTAKEIQVPIDNEGKTELAWTFDGHVPGPLFRATEGDTIEFTLKNDAANQKSHSIDLHAARVDVLGPFGPVKPGETKTFTFTADNPGIYFYHCGADPMIQHIARGMFGAIIIDPKDPNALPKADREYVLIEHQMFENPEDVKAMMANNWKHNAYNGIPFKYDPVHDTNATKTLEALPGERVRIYYVNAGPNEFAGFHPIAGIWDKVYPSGNPKNVLTAVQNYTIAPGDAATFDLISPVEGANALVNHSMRLALSGAIAIVMFSKDADPEMGRGDKILVR